MGFCASLKFSKISIDLKKRFKLWQNFWYVNLVLQQRERLPIDQPIQKILNKFWSNCFQLIQFYKLSVPKIKNFLFLNHWQTFLNLLVHFEFWNINHLRSCSSEIKLLFKFLFSLNYLETLKSSFEYIF